MFPLFHSCGYLEFTCISDCFWTNKTLEWEEILWYMAPHWQFDATKDWALWGWACKVLDIKKSVLLNTSEEWVPFTVTFCSGDKRQLLPTLQENIFHWNQCQFHFPHRYQKWEVKIYEWHRQQHPHEGWEFQISGNLNTCHLVYEQRTWSQEHDYTSSPVHSKWASA